MSSQIRFELVLPETKKKLALEDLSRSGFSGPVMEHDYRPGSDPWSSPDGSRFDPLVVLAFLATTPYVARQIQKLRHDEKNPGGVVIDARGGQLRLHHVPSLDQGTLVIFTDDGESVYRTEQDQVADAAIKAVLTKLER